MTAITPIRPSWEVNSRVPWQESAAFAYPLLLLVAVFVAVAANLGHPLLHDSFPIDWVWADQFTAELAAGNLYPRWLPLSYAGLGSPVFYYYPPLSFHVVGLFGLLGLSTYASLIAGFGAAFAASGIACWHWLKGRSENPLLASVIFVLAPYHLLDFTVRGALAETWATALIPLIAIGLRRIGERRGGVLLTACAYGAIIGTHLPLALLVSLFLIAPYALVHGRRLAAFAAAVAGGIGLAAIYLIPALALEPYHDVAKLYRSENLRTAYWSLFSGNWRDGVYLAVFVIIGSLALALRPALTKRDGWGLYAAAILIAVSGIVPFLWSLPLIEKVQFPFRALPLAELGLVTALARLPRATVVSTGMLLLPLSLLILVVPGFQIEGDDLAAMQARHPDVYEYLPRGVIPPGQTTAHLDDVLATRIPPPSVPGMVVEKTFYFPAWSCGEPEPRTQLLMHEPGCTPHLRATLPERGGAGISLATALLLLFVAGFSGRATSGVRARIAAAGRSARSS
jgi:hypothetical protein